MLISRIAVAAAIAAAVALLSACATAPPPPAAAHSQAAEINLPKSTLTDALVECLAIAGWVVTRDPTGGVDSGQIPSAQSSSYQSAYSTCADSTGWSNFNADMSVTQLTQLYAQELTEYKCLTALGYAPGEPPSLQKYLDTHRTKDQYYAFYPTLVGLPEAEYIKTVAKCPPPTIFPNLDAD